MGEQDLTPQLLLGLISRRINYLNSCHTFSIGLQSGNSGGVHHQLIPLELKKVCAKIILHA